MIINFYLLKSEEEGTSKKDLGNLVGVFCDVLSEYIIKNTTDDGLKGLGFDAKAEESLVTVDKTNVENTVNLFLSWNLYQRVWN